jgi:hypothetical protein
VLTGEADVGAALLTAWPVLAERAPGLALAYRENYSGAHQIHLAQFAPDGRRPTRDRLLALPYAAPGCGQADAVSMIATPDGYALAWSSVLPPSGNTNGPSRKAVGVVMSRVCAP